MDFGEKQIHGIRFDGISIILPNITITFYSIY